MADNTRRILITGSRRWADPQLIADTLIGWWDANGRPNDVELVHGECPYGGADEQGADVWQALWLPVRAVPMTTRYCDADCYHKRPAVPGKCPRRGPERNQAMVDLGGYLAAFAFPLPDSRGTLDCVARIKAARIPFTEVKPRRIPARVRYG
ncbi:hypothetical protein [Nocardia terpenica]|uniref:DUF2493 domain-containing protein n=1 Tax=Nocardia terpenica TaxID=455432 RepID=A0A164K7L5_9NOCA|nr:hypothetical protein [Nocardia terpenica]KZM71117.1 hypothetical protein AWN90_42150 [Nocardia terpenica]NQE89559.1 hypothetical protein [Nocardia terpenica]